MPKHITIGSTKYRLIKTDVKPKPEKKEEDAFSAFKETKTAKLGNVLLPVLATVMVAVARGVVFVVQAVIQFVGKKVRARQSLYGESVYDRETMFED